MKNNILLYGMFVIIFSVTGCKGAVIITAQDVKIPVMYRTEKINNYNDNKKYKYESEVEAYETGSMWESSGPGKISHDIQNSISKDTDRIYINSVFFGSWGTVGGENVYGGIDWNVEAKK